jgi:hypothetical protein
MKRLVAVLVPALLLASAPRARAAAPAQPTPIAVELARYVLPEESWNRTLAGISQQTSQAMAQTIEQHGGSVPLAVAEKFRREFGKLFSYQEIVDFQASVLAKYYTDAELRELLAFYKTPLGQKAIRIMPDVAQDVNGQLIVIMQQRLPPMMEKLKAELESAAAGEGSGTAKAPAPPAKPAGKK